MTDSGIAKLQVSTYDREACEIGVVHIGPGAFHRAHQALYIDAMMEKTGDLSWGIAAVNLRASDSQQLVNLEKSSDGYVVKSISADGAAEFIQVRSIVAFSDWSQNAAAAERLLAEASVKMLSMTVTESGYSIDGNGDLNQLDPLLIEEVNGTRKTSVYAYLRAGLNLRRISQAGPISVLCCDNLRANGELLERNFLAYLTLCKDTELIDWLANNASFPSSMVDRITPKPDRRVFDEVARLFGRVDDPSVLSEDYIQWVIEDNFAAQRPPLGQVGVQIVDSVVPYEETKILVLNGGHTSLSYLGVLQGHHTFDQAMNDAELEVHFRAYENEEVLPGLPQDLPFDRHQYLEIIIERFKNSNVADALERICTDGVSKFPIYILPTMINSFEAGRVPNWAINSIASWYVFAKRIHDGDLAFNYIEPKIALLQPYLEQDQAAAFANSSHLWGELPQSYPEFSNVLCQKIEQLNLKYTADETGSLANQSKRNLG